MTATRSKSHEVKPVAWARVWPAVRPPYSRNLRQGAWYPVLKNERDDRVTLLLYGHPVDVPRRFLEIRGRRPTHFSVVYRVGYDRDARRQSKYNLGKRYAVCPACSLRFALFGQPEKKSCPECGHTGEVGWWE